MGVEAAVCSQNLCVVVVGEAASFSRLEPGTVSFPYGVIINFTVLLRTND